MTRTVLRTFGAAAATALGGMAAGAAVRSVVLGERHPEAAAYLVVLFGWPFALLAVVAALTAYAVLCAAGRGTWVTAWTATAFGLALGAAAGLWLRDALLGPWAAGVGAAAGRVWWAAAGGAHRGGRVAERGAAADRPPGA